MSAKVKRRFEEMQAYLGRDTEGLKKLKLLKDDVNELRTSLAAAKEQLEQMVAIKDAARERADAAEAELVRVRLEQDRLNQMLQGLARRATAAEVEIKKLTTSDDIVDTPDAAQSTETMPASIQAVYATLRKLRKIITRRPPEVRSVRVAGVVTQVPLYRLGAVLEDWTHNRIWALGAFVAIQSQVDSAVVITGNAEPNLLTYVRQNPGSALGDALDTWMRDSVDAATVNMANRSLTCWAAKTFFYKDAKQS